MPYRCIKPACDSMGCVMCNCAVPENAADHEIALPIIPPIDPFPHRPADGAVAICGLCGLRVMPVMGYVCGNPRCGVFPQVTCSA